ncbi:Ppx/GppA phosphatase family protein [Candidatus Nesciobacter abundans]|uniref:Ppx/GppA phosphatase N-terminal domain-containing protein n=1 Tax=Candidatus Nesciobacter abundans TaxID=2601668 RepID=A0A5C0UHV8_9PROT|nr:hypothetical protein [Candidatus Nesciobacter abundans]QEK39163.1 hypothetical protein FZC36_01810 [Candidatus Nesciobacter abundans]
MERSRNYACIDLGSNLCRMLIGYKNEKHGVTVLKSLISQVKLGEDIYKNGFVKEEAIDRCVNFLKKCMKVAKNYKVRRIESVVTAACRLASNKKTLLHRIKNETGLSFRMINPDEEIYFSALGCLDVMPYKDCYVIDMGGCSTEVGLFSKRNNRIYLQKWVSLPIGILKFQESGNEQHLTDDLKDIMKNFSDSQTEKLPLILSKSGIMSNISKHISQNSNVDPEVFHGKIISNSRTEQILDEIISKYKNEGLKNRNHSTYGSCKFMKDLLHTIQSTEAIVMSTKGLREGLLYKLCNNIY